MKKLDELTDELTDLLGAAEQNLVGLRLGVTAEVALDEKNALVFTKKKGTWGLYVRDEEGDSLALHASSRRHRLLASHKLDAMIGALNEAAEKELAAIQDAIAKVEEILVAFKQA